MLFVPRTSSYDLLMGRTQFSGTSFQSVFRDRPKVLSVGARKFSCVSPLDVRPKIPKTFRGHLKYARTRAVRAFCCSSNSQPEGDKRRTYPWAFPRVGVVCGASSKPGRKLWLRRRCLHLATAWLLHIGTCPRSMPPRCSVVGRSKGLAIN